MGVTAAVAAIAVASDYAVNKGGIIKGIGKDISGGGGGGGAPPPPSATAAGAGDVSAAEARQRKRRAAAMGRSDTILTRPQDTILGGYGGSEPKTLLGA